jgi:beta-ureidopropionase / N-carbamoyl-L-amino-acid hydrolase
MMGIDEDRAIADLRRLALLGKTGTGVNRPAFTDDDIAAREWLRGRMAEAGLDASVDRLGTVYGRAPHAKASILLGSHTDTVPCGGWLDGALGVIYALETARAWQAANPGAAVGVDAISFADEEGTFHACLGSQAFCGDLVEADLAQARNATGDGLLAALAHFGLLERPAARLDPRRHRAYLEAHIEQGPRLANDGVDIGVVTGIVGVRRHRVRFEGRADHAGTTPMAMRRDASFAMFRFATEVAARFRAVGTAESVWNFGVVSVKPGAANVVANEAEVVAEYRDLSSAVIDRMEAALIGLVRERDGEGGVAVCATLTGSIAPTAMNEGLIARLAAAAEGEGARFMRMPSGAGHDAMILGRCIPAAMLFVPSIGGRSHDISEDTDEADIRRGLRVFARAVEMTLDALGSQGGGAL